MSSQVIILQLAILLVVLESDTGLRKIGWFRVARPVITVCAIAPSYLSSLPTAGHDVTFQLLGLVVGAAIGALVVSPLFVTTGFMTDYRGHWARWRHKSGKPAIVSRAGWSYASVWIAICLLRLFFAYGSTHIFAHGLQTFLADNKLSAAGLTNTLIFFSIAMDLAHSVGLLVRRRHVRRGLDPHALQTHPSKSRSQSSTTASDRRSPAGAEALRMSVDALEVAAGLVEENRLEREQRIDGRRQSRLRRRRS